MKIHARYPEINAVQFDGTWKTIMGFLDTIDSMPNEEVGRRFVIPYGSHPPVTYDMGGGRGFPYLLIHDMKTGEVMEKLQTGDWLCHAIHPATGSDHFFRMEHGLLHTMYDVPMKG